MALGTVLLASSLPLVGAILVMVQHPQVSVYGQTQAPELEQSKSHLDMRTFSGKIVHSGNQYLLRSGKMSYSLDNQHAAKAHDGESVLVTGALDRENRVVRVQKIESAN